MTTREIKSFSVSGIHILSQNVSASAARMYIKGVLSRRFLKLFGPTGLEACINLDSVLGSILLLSFFWSGFFVMGLEKRWLMFF